MKTLKRQQQKKKYRKPKAGWGPYRTVMNERAVAFNLTLDVQHLEQEVRSLTVAHDILLAARALHRRHDPSGSLMHTVAAYYDLLRKGITLDSSVSGSSSSQSPPRSRSYSQSEQRAFVQSFVDPAIDCGGGLVGPDVFFEQLRRYSVFLRFLDLTLLSFEVVTADDTVIITTSGRLHIQIQRATIAGVFPHVLGHEWLVSKLVGRDVALAVTLSFYFTPADQVAKYVVDLDFLTAFTALLTDPEDVAVLFGRALIGDNCMFAAETSDNDATASAPVERATPLPIRRAVSTRDATKADKEDDEDNEDEHSHAVVRDVRVLPPASIYSVAGTRTSTAPATSTPSSALYACVVRAYFDAFASVTSRPSVSTTLSDAQQAFVTQWVSPECEYGDDVDAAGSALLVGQHVLGERWCAVADCFDVLAFTQTAQDPVVAQPSADLCFVRASAEYTLRLTRWSLQTAFPHVANEPLVLAALLGRQVTAHAQLKFWLERSTGHVACVKEAIDFTAALAPLVPHPDDLAWVLAHARLEKFSVVESRVIPALSRHDRATRNHHEAGDSMAFSYDISV